MRPSDESLNGELEYKCFDELLMISGNENSENLIENIKEELSSLDWKVQFYAIEKLRSLNKSFPKEANFIFQAFGVEILSAMSSKKHPLLKNLLLLFNEILRVFEPGLLDESVLVHLTDRLLWLHCSISKSIRSMSEHSLRLIATRALCPCIMEKLASVVLTGSKAISEPAFLFLIEGFEIIASDISRIPQRTILIIIEALSVVICGNLKNKIVARSVILHIYRQTGKDLFEALIYRLQSEGRLNWERFTGIEKVIQKSQNQMRPSVAEQLRYSLSKDPSLKHNAKLFFLEIDKNLVECSKRVL